MKILKSGIIASLLAYLWMEDTDEELGAKKDKRIHWFDTNGVMMEEFSFSIILNKNVNIEKWFWNNRYTFGRFRIY